MSTGGPRTTVVRFSATERVFHWAQAIPYLVLLVTGALQLIAHRFTISWLSAATLAQLHRIAGIALPVAMFLAFLGGDRKVLLRNARLALCWTLVDLRWLALFPLNQLFGVALPPSGKFNAGQKLNLLAQMVLIPVFAITGAWMAYGGEALLPWYVHVAAFALATPLLLGHLFLALVHPETRKGLSGVFDGRVDAQWARHHYAKEYAIEDRKRASDA